MSDDEKSSVESDLHRRLAAVEGILRHLQEEVTTQRVRVVDREGRTRIVAEIVGDTAELRVQVPDTDHPRRSQAVVYATPARSPEIAGEPDPSLGVAIQIEGDIVAELNHRV